jgi:hypothetical protein
VPPEAFSSSYWLSSSLTGLVGAAEGCFDLSIVSVFVTLFSDWSVIVYAPMPGSGDHCPSSPILGYQP